MKIDDDDLVHELLCSSVLPAIPQDLKSDLWPLVVASINSRQPRWGIWDWVAVAAAAAGLIALPGSRLLIVYVL